MFRRKETDRRGAYDHIELMGLEVEDMVTGYKGVVTTVSFDLYGCIQAVVTPKGVNDKGETYPGMWFDVNRLKVLTDQPVMQRPDFTSGHIAEGKQGAAPKPPM